MPAVEDDAEFDENPRMTEKARDRILGGAILLITLTLYIPAILSGFIWDDDKFLWQNPLIHDPGGLLEFWFSKAAPDYFPLTSTTLWLEWRLWGAKSPWGYHLINVLLHAGTSLFLWRLLKRLRVPAAWLCALIFAIHPVNVESVAWITERKNTLPMFFTMLSALFYFREGGRPRWSYAVALVLFVLALLSKTCVVTFPVVLLLTVWWQHGKLTWRDVRRTAPFFLVSLILSLVTIWFQYTNAIGDIPVRTDGFAARLAGAGWAVWFYLYKALLPINLLFVYPRWGIDPHLPLVYVPGVLLVVVMALLWWLRKRIGRGPLFALVAYMALLFPVVGFFDIYFMAYSLVADHWQYPAMPVIIAFVVGGLAGIAQQRRQPWRHGAMAVAAAVVIVLFTLSWRQQAMYKDSKTLWKTLLKQNPECWMATNNLGAELLEEKRHDEAIEYLMRTLEIKSDHSEAYNNIGTVLYDRGQYEEALTYISKALMIRPNWPPAQMNLGLVLMRLGRIDAAGQHLVEGLEGDASAADAIYSLGVVEGMRGKYDEAAFYFRRTLELRATHAKAHHALALALVNQGRPAEALPYLQRAVELDPGFAEAQHDLKAYRRGELGPGQAIARYQEILDKNPEDWPSYLGLAKALSALKRFQDAHTVYQHLLNAKPAFIEARLSLAAMLTGQGDIGAAREQYREVVKRQPDSPQALDRVAWVLATSDITEMRDGTEAVRLATRACELTDRQSPFTLSTLAAAHAEIGDFTNALLHIAQAVKLAAESDNKALQEELRQAMASYQQQRPLRSAHGNGAR